MGSLTKYCLVSYLVFVLAMAGNKPCSGSKHRILQPLSKWEVTVVNSLSQGQVLSLHCKSKDDDLGEQSVPAGQNFSWKFRQNIWGTTLFWCNFRTPTNRHKSIEVIWQERKPWLASRCNYATCIWVAKDDGIYLANIPRGVLEHIHDWEVPGL